ncbi:MAG: HAD family hydrolase [Pasteurellaceae bacterium]|nr:HAD family hydrolase [Pasteurellaceae bacterium]
MNFCQDLPPCNVSHLQVIKGQGILAYIDGQEVRVGKADFAKTLDFSPPCDRVGTQLFVAVGGKTVGVIYLQDQLRPESARLIKLWQTQGYRCVILTGDRQATAAFYAEQLGVKHVIADVLPEQKSRENRPTASRRAKYATESFRDIHLQFTT